MYKVISVHRGVYDSLRAFVDELGHELLALSRCLSALNKADDL